MERPRILPEGLGRLQKPALALAAIMTLAACRGNFPGSPILSQELASGQAHDGRAVTLLATNTNVQVEVGFVGDGPTNMTEAGILPKDTFIEPVIVFETDNGGKAAAFPCEAVRQYLYTDWKYSTVKDLSTSVCYAFNKGGNFTFAKTTKTS